jgi:hypothetical protein
MHFVGQNMLFCRIELHFVGLNGTLSSICNMHYACWRLLAAPQKNNLFDGYTSILGDLL